MQVHLIATVKDNSINHFNTKSLILLKRSVKLDSRVLRINGLVENFLTNNYMSITMTRLNTRIRNIENILTRLKSGEYNLQCPDQCRTAY